HRAPVRDVRRVAREQTPEVAASRLVRTRASERVAEQEDRRAPLGRLRERIEARRLHEVHEIADRLVATARVELRFDGRELATQSLAAQWLACRELASSQRLL